MTYEDGIHDLSNEDYHGSTGLSRSALMLYQKSPRHYYEAYLNPERIKPEPTDAMIKGELVHTLCLEPHKTIERFAVLPELDKRTKAGKQAFEEFCIINEGKQYIKPDVYESCKAIADSFQRNTLFNALLLDARIEKSLYFTHKETGIQCKVRPDVWNYTIVADLKTTADASYKAFQGSAYKYGYFLQAGMIHEALKSIDIDMQKFVFACVETSSPYVTALYDCDGDAIQFGVKLFNTLMYRFSEHYEKDEWPDYGYQTLSVPAWATYEIDFVD
jgi:hypothetical protein